MSFTKKAFLAAVLVAAAVFVAAAAADHGGDRGRGEHRGHVLLHQRLVGSILSDPPIHGVVRGGLPWQGGGDASLDRKGRFQARIRGLVIPGMGNPGPVTTITISLYCAPDSGTAAAFTTDPVPLSPQGDARVRQHVTVPSRCLAPVLLVHPNGGAAAYIAATGFTG
ncbi:MAG TPA: hypothetical protein VLD16_09900 [Gaiellaceae bacterium]|nr:hypothetical protein [Gaiellaceae bacterium]